MTGEPGLRIERPLGGAIARLTIARKDRGNSLTGPLLLALEGAARALAADGTRAAILTGDGEKAFSTGYDVQALLEEAQGSSCPAPEALENHPLERALRAIAGGPVPFVAAIRGAATGAGLELACACDLRVAGRSARFLMPPARLGLVYSGTGVARLLGLAGQGIVRELFMLAEPIDAERAVSVGLVTRLCADADVEEQSLALARRLAENAPLTISSLKEMLHRGLATPLPDAAARAEIARLREAALASADFAEGVAAFLERRKPRFGASSK